MFGRGSRVMQDHLPENIGYFSRAMPGETRCGDVCSVWCEPDRMIMMLADGLGHGPDAASAAEAAVRCISDNLHRSCEEALVVCDQMLRNTRGVALALAVVDTNSQRLTLATVGNIRAALLRGQSERHLGGARGIVGGGFKGLAPEVVDLMQGDFVVLYSDGFDEFLPVLELIDGKLSSRQIAETALKRWAKASDDASMLVYRHKKNSDVGV